MQQKFIAILLTLIMFFVTLSISAQDRISQVLQSPTPIPVNLVTPTPFTFQQAVATVTPTFTPTPKGPVLLEARESAGSVNVRTEPDPNAQRLGSISFGTQYPVLRQYYSWYELQYETSPSGRAWVYGELVDIVGDVSEIEIIDSLEAQATEDPSISGATQTWEAITLQPGGLQTATANARVLVVPTVVENVLEIEAVLESSPLPTFTYPADASAIIPTQVIVQQSSADDNNVSLDTIKQIPPILPIMLLGGFGIIGLLLNSLRR